METQLDEKGQAEEGNDEEQGIAIEEVMEQKKATNRASSNHCPSL